MSLNQMRSLKVPCRNSRLSMSKTNHLQTVPLKPQQIIKKNQIVPTTVSYDPKKNLLLKRNMLVIQRQIWETQNNVKQYKQDSLQQFLALHESTKGPPNNLAKMLQQTNKPSGPTSPTSQLNDLATLKSVDNYSEKYLSQRSCSNICEVPELNTPLLVSQSPALDLTKQYPRKQSAQSEKINFLMIGTKKKQSLRSIKCPETSTNLSRQPLRARMFSTSTIRHDDPQLQTCELLQQPQPAINNFIVSVASSQVVSLKKQINFRAKSATVRRDYNRPSPIYCAYQQPTLMSPQRKKSSMLNEDIHLLTGQNFAEITSTQEDLACEDPPPKPSVPHSRNGSQYRRTLSPQQVTLEVKSSLSMKEPLVLGDNASLVRTINLKRAALISASHTGTSQFKMEGQEGQFLIQTSNGCHILGDSARTTALSVAIPPQKPQKKQRQSSAAHRRVRGSTVTLQSRKLKQQTKTKEQFEDVPLFGLVPTYRIASKYAFPKNSERVVYKLVVDKKSFQSNKPQMSLKQASQFTVHGIESTQ